MFRLDEEFGDFALIGFKVLLKRRWRWVNTKREDFGFKRRVPGFHCLAKDTRYWCR